MTTIEGDAMARDGAGGWGWVAMEERPPDRAGRFVVRTEGRYMPGPPFDRPELGIDSFDPVEGWKMYDGKPCHGRVTHWCDPPSPRVGNLVRSTDPSVRPI